MKSANFFILLVAVVSSGNAVTRLEELESGVARDGIDGCMGATDCFYIDTYEGNSCLTFTSYGGEGESPFYIKAGAQASKFDYDYKQERGGTYGKIFIPEAAAHSRYFICFFGTIEKPFQNISLEVILKNTIKDECGCSIICPGTKISGLSSGKGEDIRLSFEVKSPGCDVTISSEGDGDLDLYLKYGSQPEIFSYDSRPYKSSSNEVVSMKDAQIGKYFLLLVDFDPYEDVTVSYDVVCKEIVE